MAVIISDHKSIFVHIPKTGGMSIQRWLLDNTNSYVTKGSKHHSLTDLEEKYGKFDFSFTTVRNPWDWCVSWYFFRRDRALRRINNPKNKGKFSLEYNQKVLNDFEKGFDYFLKTTSLKTQCSRIAGITTVLKLENIEVDIKPIAEKFNINSNIPFINISNRDRNYRQYYNSITQNIVKEKFKDDISMFGYEF
jgi:hypothetical protein